MNKMKRFLDTGKNFAEAMIRFPMTIILLVAAVVTNAISILDDYDDFYIKLLITFLLGACIYTVFQMIYEKFCINPTWRYLFAGFTLILSVMYYLIIRENISELVVAIRTLVLFFILLIAFLWIPSIHSRYNFNDSFMAVFKAFFSTLFFQGVLFLGIILIYGVTDLLILQVNEDLYIHTANIIFLLLAPIQFLSLIPQYPQRNESVLTNKIDSGEAPEQMPEKVTEQMPEKVTEQMPEKVTEQISENITEQISEKVTKQISARETEKMSVKVTDQISENVSQQVQEKAFGLISEDNERYKDREVTIARLITPAKFLAALISYVVIPITAVFTVILLLYIIINITGDFWKNNLMEPMLVSYSITVIIVYLLASTIQNVFTRYFRMIFPKVLVPIVLFQTVASILKINENGISYGRYYVIMFGIFAIISGVIFCIKPTRHNGLIAPVLIVLSCISILPVIGAFSISEANQISRLENVLLNNDMLKGGIIEPKEDLSQEDKDIIISAVDNLEEMQVTDEISWLEDYSETYNFKATFGFDRYPVYYEENRYVMIIRDQNAPIPVSGYDFMVKMNLYSYSSGIAIDSFEKNGKIYHVTIEGTHEEGMDIVLSEADGEIARFSMNSIYDKFIQGSEKTSLDTSEVTFTEENDKAVLTVVAESISINIWEDGEDKEAEVYVLVKIK